MNCNECLEHLYEFLDRELTPQLEAEMRAHFAECNSCDEQADFERAFLKFVEARCRSQGAPAELKRKILRDLLGE